MCLSASDKNKRIVYYTGIIGLFLFLVLLFPSQSPLFHGKYTMTADYLEFAKAMLHGKVLYTDLYDHKGLFLFLCYIPAYLLDKTGYTGVYMCEFFSGCLYAYNIYRFCLLNKTKEISVWYTLFLVVLTRICFPYLYYNTDFLCICFFLYLARYVATNKYKRYQYKTYIFFGICCGAIIWSKFPLIIVAIPFWIFLCVQSIKIHKIRSFLLCNAVALGAFIGFSSLMSIYFIVHHNFAEMLRVYFMSPSSISIISVIPFLPGGALFTLFLIDICLTVCIISTVQKHPLKYFYIIAATVWIYLLCIIGCNYCIYATCSILPLIITALPYVSPKTTKKAIAILCLVCMLGINIPIFVQTSSATDMSLELYNTVGQDSANDILYISEDYGASVYAGTDLRYKYQWKPDSYHYSDIPQMAEAVLEYIEMQKTKFVWLSNANAMYMQNSAHQADVEILRTLNRQYTVVATYPIGTLYTRNTP